MSQPVGWRREPARHSLASRGVKTTSQTSTAAARPISKAAEKRQEKERSLEYLRGLLPPGTKVYTSLSHVARSGMSRNIKVLMVKDGQMIDISYYVANITEYPRASDGSVRVGGAGMDMGFALVYDLSRRLYPDGFKTPPGYWRNEPLEFDTDGGYALKQEWI